MTEEEGESESEGIERELNNNNNNNNNNNGNVVVIDDEDDDGRHPIGEESSLPPQQHEQQDTPVAAPAVPTTTTTTTSGTSPSSPISTTPPPPPTHAPIEEDGNDKASNQSPAPAPPIISIRQLTIRNLDTGEEFIIGENDPDFDFDTFEIGSRQGQEDGGEGVAAGGGGGGGIPTTDTTTTPTTARGVNGLDSPEAAAAAHAAQERISWWRSFFRFIYGARQDKVDEKMANVTEESSSNKPKTPFTKLSSFKFRKELGKGAFGRVLLAEARTDGHLYALKIISKKNMRSSDRRQAKAERDILHAMTLKAPHPFTSGLKFAFQSENNLYLGMDYIPGGNLRELIKRFKYLPEDWVRFYAAELVLAISHLHSMNVLYRDIKPHNVMIDARGHVILIDFGLSKQEISHPRGALSLVGTPDYSAPEVLRTGVQQIEAHNREKAARAGGGKKKKGKRSSTDDLVRDDPIRMSHIGYGKAADWWSLGIMIYEMISGKPTFRGADLRETYQRILYAKLEFVPEDRFSPAARYLLEGLINRDPSLRLGAWENPPRDIMSSPFFATIEWDAIYDRIQDGPWIPDLPHYYLTSLRKGSFMSKPRDSFQSMNSPMREPSLHGLLTSPGERNRLVFSPAPMDRYTPISDLELAKAGHPAPVEVDNNNNNGGQSPTPKNEGKPSGNDEEDNDESEEDDDDDDDDEEDEEEVEEEEELHIRDSVFYSKEDVQNRLPDWSYIDADVLMSYLNEEENKETKTETTGSEKKNKKSKNKNNKDKNNNTEKKNQKVRELLDEAREKRREKAAAEKAAAGSNNATSTTVNTLDGEACRPATASTKITTTTTTTQPDIEGGEEKKESEGGMTVNQQQQEVATQGNR